MFCDTPASKSASFKKRAIWSQPLPGEDGAVILMLPWASAAAAKPTIAAAKSPRQRYRSKRDACCLKNVNGRSPRAEPSRLGEERQANALSEGSVRLKGARARRKHDHPPHPLQRRPTPPGRCVLARG